MSLPEGLLWQRLRKKQGGAKFRRQHPIGPYVLDFYCAAARLAVEIDGRSHEHGDRPQRDEVREAFLVGRDLTVIRIPAAEVLHDPDSVADALARRTLPLHRPSDGSPPHPADGEELTGAP